LISAVEVVAYAGLENDMHLVLKLDDDTAAGWSDAGEKGSGLGQISSF